MNSGKAVVPEGVQPTIHFARIPVLPVPPSLSTAGQGAVNALPGVGRLPVGWGDGSAAAQTGALSAQSVPFPEGATLREVNAILAPEAPTNSAELMNERLGNSAPNVPPITPAAVPNLSTNAIPLMASHWTSYNFRNLPANARSVTSNGGTTTEARTINTILDSGAPRHALATSNNNGGGAPPSGAPLGGGGGGSPNDGGGGGARGNANGGGYGGPPFYPHQGGTGGGGGGPNDGLRVVDRILATSPDVWDGLINSRNCPDIFSLMSTLVAPED
ncbi:hypothetical protein K438DRAFT_1770833 [Mycena galopus ATCC 62051]|nr:hypothetical protein K438DRAFT_1770833 [Mycena galopus ATCC 62051]